MTWDLVGQVELGISTALSCIFTKMINSMLPCCFYQNVKANNDISEQKFLSESRLAIKKGQTLKHNQA